MPGPDDLTGAAWIVLVASVVTVCLLAETVVSTVNERRLRRDGAVEPAGDVYRAMRVAYPAAFGAMLAEGLLRDGVAGPVAVVGAVVWLAAKALKYWAVATLGRRWSFRLLVVPGAPLVASGPYRVVKHPNYLAVVGELIGVACLTGAWVSGLLSLGVFVPLILRRVAVEDAWLRPRSRG